MPVIFFYPKLAWAVAVFGLTMDICEVNWSLVVLALLTFATLCRPLCQFTHCLGGLVLNKMSYIQTVLLSYIQTSQIFFCFVLFV